MLIAKSISLSDIGIFEGAAQSAQQQNLNHAPCVRRFGDIVNVRRTKPRKGSGLQLNFAWIALCSEFKKMNFAAAGATHRHLIMKCAGEGG